MKTSEIAVTERRAEQLCGFGRQSFRRMRREDRGPAYVRIGSSVRYLVSDLVEWLESHRFSSRGEEVARHG